METPLVIMAVDIVVFGTRGGGWTYIPKPLSGLDLSEYLRTC